MSTMDQIRYQGKKSRTFGVFLTIFSIVILFVSFGLPLILDAAINTIQWIVIGFICLPIIGLFIWCWRTTYYIVAKDLLIAKCGPFRWKIPIDDIKVIRLDQKTIGGTWKPTLSWNCIEIENKNGWSIYISPEKQDDFIGQLTTLNSTIKIR